MESNQSFPSSESTLEDIEYVGALPPGFSEANTAQTNEIAEVADNTTPLNTSLNEASAVGILESGLLKWLAIIAAVILLFRFFIKRKKSVT